MLTATLKVKSAINKESFRCTPNKIRDKSFSPFSRDLVHGFSRPPAGRNMRLVALLSSFPQYEKLLTTNGKD